MKTPDPPLCFLAQLATGPTCVGTDRDGEAWMKLLLSRADAAVVMTRLDELAEGFYVTVVPESQVRAQLRHPRVLKS